MLEKYILKEKNISATVGKMVN